MSTNAEIRVGTVIFFQSFNANPPNVGSMLLEYIKETRRLAAIASDENLGFDRLLLMLLREDERLIEIQWSIKVDYIFKITPKQEIYWKDFNEKKWIKFPLENKK